MDVFEFLKGYRDSLEHEDEQDYLRTYYKKMGYIEDEDEGDDCDEFVDLND